jgi:hypothetical protein
MGRRGTERHRSLRCAAGWDLAGKVRQAGEAIEAAGEDAAHERAGRDDLRIAESIADLASGALGLDDAGGPHDREVLRGVRLADPEIDGDPSDLDRPVREPMDDLESAGMRERAHDLGLEDVDLVHEALEAMPTLKEVGAPAFERAQRIRVVDREYRTEAALDEDQERAFGLFIQAIEATLARTPKSPVAAAPTVSHLASPVVSRPPAAAPVATGKPEPKGLLGRLFGRR